MAGIMALINQKYGPQGQANFVLYPLAAQYPTVFNDVTIGNNNEPCYSSTVGSWAGCAKDKNDSYYSLQNYYATPGYDEASGLGTIDVNQLLTYWSKITFTPSTTTLTLAPATITHGTNVTATATVTGKGTPAGAVSLVANTTLPNNKSVTYVQLGAGGTGSTQFTNLPGGTYTLTGQYSGDGINAPSTSAPVTVTVAPEASILAFSPQYQDPITLQPDPITKGTQVPYNSNLLMDIQIEGAAGTVDGSPTGTVTFTNGSTILATVPVSAQGTAEYNANSLPPGTYSIGASYSGDASYKASTVAPVTFSVVQAGTQGFIFPDFTVTYNPDGSYGYLAGQSTNISALIFPNVEGGVNVVCPTGSVTFQLGSAAPATFPLVPCEFLEYGYYSVANDVLTNLQAGTYTLTVTYTGDANFTPLTLTQLIEVVPSKLLPSTTTFTISPALSSITPTTIVTLTATVAGNGTITPTGSIGFSLANTINGGTFNLKPTGNGTATAAFSFRAADLLTGPNSMVINYLGDSNYLPSVASVQVVPNDPTDFTLATTTPIVAITSGSTSSASFILGSENGFAGSVALTCTAPAALACTLPSASVSLTAGGNATATININTVTATGVSGRNSTQGPLWKGLAAPVFAAMLLFFIPNRKRFGRVLFALVFCVALGAVSGCTHSQHTTAEPVFTYANAAPGTYNIVVTGTAANGIVHNQNVTIVVQ
jgi:hypothetical protein